MEKSAKEALSLLTRQTNLIFKNREPWQIVAITATSVLSTVWLWNFLNQDESELTFIFCKRKTNLHSMSSPYSTTYDDVVVVVDCLLVLLINSTKNLDGTTGIRVSDCRRYKIILRNHVRF